MNQRFTYILLSIILLFPSLSFQHECSDYIIYFPDYKCKSEEPIGSGSVGRVFLITKDDKEYTMKWQSKSKRSDSELKHLEDLKNLPYVINLYDKKIIGNHVLTIMDFGSRGSLFELMEDEEFISSYMNVLKLFKKIVKGVQGIHQRGIIHADLKLENVVVDQDYNPYVIDFDLAVSKDTEDRGRGTLSYIPPEVLNVMYNHSKFKFNEKTDVYSLGVIFYALLTGFFPFEIEPSKYNLRDVLIKSPVEFDIGFPEDAMDLTLMCLQLELKRATIDKLYEELNKKMLKPSQKKLAKIMTFTMRGMATKIIPFNSEDLGDEFSFEDEEIIENKSNTLKNEFSNIGHWVKSMGTLSVFLFLLLNSSN